MYFALSRKFMANKYHIPCGICSGMMLSNVHNPADMMLHWRIIAMTGLSFPWRFRINRRSIFYNGKETRRSIPSIFSGTQFITPTILFRSVILFIWTCAYELLNKCIASYVIFFYKQFFTL